MADTLPPPVASRREERVGEDGIYYNDGIRQISRCRLARFTAEWVYDASIERLPH
jgi:hypothetical protein